VRVVGERASAVATVWLPALLVAGCAGRPRPLDDPDRWPAGECLARFTLAHDTSPVAELRELGGWRGDAQDRFPAAVIDPSAQRAFTATAGLRLDGQPIAWLSRTLDAVVLDGAAFAPLRGASALEAEPGAPRAVGRVVPRAREAMGDRAVLELLLRIQAIRTYEQLGADLCLTAEHFTQGAYRAELTGVHQFMITRATGRALVQETRFSFAVEIDPEGQVSVVGRE
jgi:hypothetical protein